MVAGDAAAEVRSLKQQPGGDLAVSGPSLALSLARAGLVDEYRLVIFPVIRSSACRLEETRTFHGGAVYLRYVRR